MSVLVVDGGDRACGELLLALHARLRDAPAGARVRLVATDPAAPLDVPAWCHLTGHVYGGAGRHTDGRPCYSLTVSAGARRPRPGRPWHTEPDPARPDPVEADPVQTVPLRSGVVQPNSLRGGAAREGFS